MLCKCNKSHWEIVKWSSRPGDNLTVTKCIKIFDKNVLAELKGNVSFDCFEPPGSETCAISSVAFFQD